MASIQSSSIPDLVVIYKLVYEPCNFVCSQPIIEPEGAEYGACRFTINNLHLQFRVAKITPKKNGLFVTLWKRLGNGPIIPYDASDNVDLFVISTRKESNFGHFVFPKSVLQEKNIISTNKKGGKRGFRVYPPWDTATNKQAQETQAWQLNYFLEIPTDKSVNCAHALELYSKVSTSP